MCMHHNQKLWPNFVARKGIGYGFGLYPSCIVFNCTYVYTRGYILVVGSFFLQHPSPNRNEDL